MNRAVIEERIHASIRPQLDYADELLDYYMQDAPPEVWGPIADSFIQLVNDPAITADLYWKHP